jgi:hypothetical protein
MTQSEPSNNEFTESSYSDSNEASDDDEERSPSARPARRRNRSLPPDEPESSHEAYISAPRVIETREVETVADAAPAEDPWDFGSSSKRGKQSKKSKISERRAIFES